MKKSILLISGAVLIVSVMIGILYSRGYIGLGIKRCPDAWVEDQMPGSNKNQYLSVDGKRREVSEFNIKWIQNNCKVNKPSVAY